MHTHPISGMTASMDRNRTNVGAQIEKLLELLR